METLGKRIREARGKHSQDIFCELIGVSKGSLGFYERDENLPKVDVAIKICSVTGVTLSWLLTGEGPMRPGEPTPKEPVAGNSSVQRKEERLIALEEERRELSVENRQLHRDKAALLQEMADMRERIARLEEQAKAVADTVKQGFPGSTAHASAPSAPSTAHAND